MENPLVCFLPERGEKAATSLDPRASWSLEAGADPPRRSGPAGADDGRVSAPP